MNTPNLLFFDRGISVDMTLTSCRFPLRWHCEVKRVLDSLCCYSVSDAKWDLVAERMVNTFGNSFWLDLGKYKACFSGDGETHAQNQCRILLSQVVSDELNSFLL